MEDVGLFHVYRTCLELLHDRDYVVPYLLQDGTDKRMPSRMKRDREWFDRTFPRGRPDLMTVFRQRQSGQQTYLMFESSVVSKPALKKLISRFAPDVTQCIFVFAQKPTPAARTQLHEMNTDDNPRVYLQYFYEDELLVNHIVDGVSILAGGRPPKNIRMNSLPRIATDDWTVRYLGARVGDIIRIRRRSETAGRYTNYREVTHCELLPKNAPVKRQKV